MKKLKAWAVCSLLSAGAGYAVSVFALPAPGPGQEVYSVYYSDASRTTEVGVRAHYHDYICDSWHIDWGVTSQYRRVVTAGCIVNGGPLEF